MLVIAESLCEEVGDGYGSDLLCVYTESLCNEKPVKVCSDCKSDGCPGCFGKSCRERKTRQTIRRLRNHGRTEAVEPDPVLEIPLNAYIPDAYISNPRYKLELYRRFVDLHWGDADNLMDEIIDRFGTPPEEVEELWHLAQVRALCRRIGILRISVRSGMIRIIFLPKARADGEYLIGLVQLHAGRMQMHYDPKGNWLTYRTAGLELEPLTWLEKELPRWIV